ncbi:hypothetical protein AYO44_14865 [Planctomycetaceae bacterium SCGC AG-212-F19]|nr:hypothetical protein AYO44_14865 [Planctomycetaceae bacterium SCGC AG-212-F19]
MRPRDLALLLLASEELRPRKRMRSQHPDTMGMELKRRLLERIADIDPDADNLEPTLARLIDELGPAPGPIRALAIGFRDDWRGLASNPDWLEQLREEAAREGGDGGGRRLHS